MPNPQQVADELAALNQQKALSQAGNIALAGLGIGASARGLQGLYGLLSRNTAPVAEAPSSLVPIPYVAPEDKKKKRESLLKGAGVLPDTGHPTTPDAVLGSLPLKVLGGGAGLYGGYKLMDYVLDKRRQSAVQSDVDKAKKEFEAALLAQTAAPGMKMSTDSSIGTQLGQTLNELHGLLRKQSNDMVNQMINGYGVYAGGTGLLAAMAAYQLAQKHTQRKSLQDALKQKKINDYATRPPEVFAQAIPTQAPMEENVSM